MSELSYVFAFVAGAISFLSPCVLPLVPGFMAYLAGTTLKESSTHRKDIFISSLFFVLGFSLVFATLGIILNTILESIAFDVQLWVARGGGVLIVLFGLYLLGFLKIPFLQRDHKISAKKKFKSKHLTSFIFGAAFAAGWSSCASAILGSIFALAATKAGSAFLLLIAYSVGLGLPFIITGLFASRASDFFEKNIKLVGIINKIFGAFLILLGILVFTQKLNQFSNLSNLLEFFI